ncbi:sensor histidine kinase [Clostridium sediminicola]|uniref:LytS/YhcK type 5TM receptor domain-containing protein n=1 Tax=Clostridium sediminicola TaxID=3114879 RepID=UPI0031F212EB
MIWILSINLLERLGLIIMFAFFISKSIFFKNYVLKVKSTFGENLFFALLWGVLGILMTLLGTPVSGGIANSRTIPVVLSGLLGGPLVGTISGLIAGVHRAFFTKGGDLTAISCGISTVIGGLIGGYAKSYIDKKNRKWIYGIIVGLLVEIIQMAIILLIAKPYDQALKLVKIIFIPMTFLNALGIGLFLLFIQQIYEENENAAALKAQVSLKIANHTLPLFRRGLDEESAEKACSIIRKITKYDAVSITDKSKVLAHVGLGSDHHKVGGEIWTDITKKSIETGMVQYAINKAEIGCGNSICPLKSVIVAPLKMNENVIGALKIYKDRENFISKSDIELVKGLGILFSTGLDLGNIEKQKKLRKQAELKALRAQIKPHFLFNSLNAIISITRTNPEEARRLLRELSIFLRSSFKDSDPFISIDKEIRNIEAYLNIEKARFPDKLFIEYDIDENINIMIPSLILQPLVENAVKHGIRNKRGKGKVYIGIKNEGDKIKFIVKDDGLGMESSKISQLEKSEGVGLSNVISRLKSIYNEELIIDSVKNLGTTIRFQIPINGGIQ